MALSIWPKNGVKQSGIPIFDNMSGSDEIDLRSELKDLLNGTSSSPQRGHWVLLRRTEKTQRCTCWNERGSGDDKWNRDDRKYDEPKEDCIICKGTGWIIDDELHLVRRRIISPPIGLAGQERISPVGIMNIPYLVYYLKYYVVPKKEDKIIEIENDDDGNPVRPFVQTEMHNISITEPLRDQKGRIEYWRCACKLEAI